MKKKSFLLKIDEPCEEGWGDMLPNSDGKFCLHCNKTVVDFTLQTSYEIKSYFHYKDKGNTCGRFTSAQLNDQYAIYETNQFNHYKFVLSLALGLLSVETMNAFSIDGDDFKKEKDSIQIVKIVESNNKDKAITTQLIESNILQQSETIVLKGKVVDSTTNEPLVGAKIIVQNTNLGTVADLDGNFIIETKNNFPFFLKVSNIGYIDVLKKINNATEKNEIKLKSDFNCCEEIIVVSHKIMGKTIANSEYNNSIYLKGKVVDSITNEALIGVNVTVQNTKIGTVTDFNGEYELSVNTGDTVSFSYVGYYENKKIATNNETYNVQLSESVLGQIGEVIITAGGAIRIDVTSKKITRKLKRKHKK